MDRGRAEQELTEILNRALRHVPFVRLDCVDEVSALFQRALDLMESSLEFSDSDEEEREKRGEQADRESNSEAQRVSQAQKLIGSSVTKDFSSPSAAKRSISGASKSAAAAQQRLVAAQTKGGEKKSGLGLGLGKPPAAAPQSSCVPMSAHHKPSSRAAGAMAANPSVVSTDEEKTDNLESEKEEITSSFVAPAIILPDVDDERAPLQAKNKILSRAGLGGSKEYPSPKLGPRSLPGTAPASRVHTPTNGDVHVQDFEVEKDSTPSAILPEAAQLGKPHMEVSYSPVTTNGSLDLEAKIKPLDKLKQEIPLPVQASPKQFKSSLHLLSLAGRPADGGAENPQGTPKPGYLRRLDSPDSHHGQLINAKAKLQTLINRALQNVPLVRTAAIPKIRAALDLAVEKLEASTVGQNPPDHESEALE